MIRIANASDAPFIATLEKVSIKNPSSASAIRYEIAENDIANYLVIYDNAKNISSQDATIQSSKLIAYLGFWKLYDEIHIVSVATNKDYKRRGYASALIKKLFEIGGNLGIFTFSLEVRKSNIPARNLYQTLGFQIVGIRPNYYADEDAVIMTLTTNIDTL